MKAKLKFDKTLILDFFVQHGEKIAFAGVALGSVLLVYFAMGGQKFDKTPDELIRKVSEADRRIDEAPSKVDATIKDPAKELAAISGKIETKPYEFPKLLVSGSVPAERNPLIYPPKTLRGEPVLYSVEDLRGVGGLGRFDRAGMGLAGPLGGGGPIAATAGQENENLGKRWIVLTGIVNNERYLKSFYDCFKNTRNPEQRDFLPEYRCFFVERAEVTDENELVENPKWEQPYKSIVEEFSRYPRGSDKVDQRFIHPRLVSPLPTRTDGQDWGKEVAHAPEIPVVAFEQMMPGARGGMLPEGTKAGTPPKNGHDPFGGADATGVGPGGPEGYGGRMAPGMRGMMPGAAYGAGSEAMRRPEMGGRYGMPTGGYGQMQDVPSLLFRFIDYNVEPGKRYRYRVRIAVANPNYNRPPQDLVKELRDRTKDAGQWSDILISPWTERPSDPICVPRDDRLLAASVAPPPEGKDRDPRGSVMAIHWDSRSGDEIHDEFEVSRGWIANFLDQKMPVSEEQTTGLGMIGGGMGGRLPEGGELLGPLAGRPGAPGRAGRSPRGRPAPAAKKPTETKTVDYITDMLVLDLRGGEKLGKNRLTSPGEMLLLDPDGNLEVRNGADDRQARLQQKNPPGSQGGLLPGAMLPGMGEYPGMPRGPMRP